MFASARLASLPDANECKEFFNMCAELKDHPHPLCDLDPNDYPVYCLPSDHPKIKWASLTFRQQRKICSFNLLDFDVIYQIVQMSPVDLITPCNKLDKLERGEAEHGQLSTTQQVQKVAYKARKLWATMKTGQREVTAYDWALLNASRLVTPMYSGSRLLWPDGDSANQGEGSGGER